MASVLHKILTSLLACLALLLAPASSLGTQPKHYWLVSSTGQVFSEGHGTKAYGSEHGKHYRGTVTGIKATPDKKGQGYWIVTSKAHYSFGDARKYKYRSGGLKKYTGKVKPRGLKGKIVGYAIATIPTTRSGGTTTTQTGTTTTGTTTTLTGTTPTGTTTTGTITTHTPTVDCSSVAISTGTLNAATATDTYSQELSAGGVSGGSWSWAIQSGSLPEGLTLSSAGVLAGTAAQSTAGTQSTFTAQATNSQCPGGPATKTFTLTVGVPPMSITTSSLPSGTYGQSYSRTQMQVTGGQPGDYQWSASGWDWSTTGLTLSTSGVLSGTVENAGTFNVTFTVVDSTGATPSVSVAIPITLSFPPLQITGPSPLADGQATVAYSSVTFTATGGSEMAQPQQDQANDYEWSATDLPPGLSMSVHGVLSGTPTQPGSYDPQVTVTDFENAVPPVTVSYPMTIADSPLQFTTTTLTAIQGQAYTGQVVARGGQAPYTMYRLAGTLPSGTTFNNGTLTVPSTATVGDYQITLGVTDSQTNAQTAQETFNLWVAPSEVAPGLNITTTETLNTTWSGYIEGASSAFTSASGTFTIPTAITTGTADDGTWLGIGGWDGDNDLIQAGVNSDRGNGQSSYEAWWETIGPVGSSQLLPPQNQFAASAGDTINVNIWQLGSDWEVTLNDVTSGQGFATQVTNYTGADETAEWITEGGAGNPAQFYDGTINFSNLAASQPGSGMTDLSMNGSSGTSLASTLGGNGFSLTY